MQLGLSGYAIYFSAALFIHLQWCVIYGRNKSDMHCKIMHKLNATSYVQNRYLLAIFKEQAILKDTQEQEQRLPLPKNT